MTQSGSGRLVTVGRLRPFRIEVHEERTDAHITAQISNHGTWEALETEVFVRLIPSFGTFLDLGANIGWYTMIAQRAMSALSRIYAFEPEAGNFALLRRNSSSRRWPWPRTTITRTAVSDRVGSVDIHLSTENQGDHRIYESEVGRARTSVPMTTLDVFFDGRALGPFIMKCDTQGSEPRIFRGGRQTLSASLADSVILLEFWPYGIVASGDDFNAFLAELAKLPHQFFQADHVRGKLRATTVARLSARCKEDLAPNTQMHADLVLLPADPGFRDAVADLIEPGG